MGTCRLQPANCTIYAPHGKDTMLNQTQIDYQFAKSAGFDVFGWENGPFVMLGDDEQTIFVFGRAKLVEDASFLVEGAHAALEVAQEHGAAFRVEGGLAVCEIGEIFRTGSSFAEAAIQTLLVRLNSKVLVSSGSAGSGESSTLTSPAK